MWQKEVEEKGNWWCVMVMFGHSHDNCQPWMLVHSSLPGMLQHHHRSGYCPTISRSHLPMVWAPHPHDQWQRPLVHLAVWNCPKCKVGHQMQPFHGLSSPNQWTLRMEKSMGRTIPAPSNLNKPKRMGTMAIPHHHHAQQLCKHNHWTIP